MELKFSRSSTCPESGKIYRLFKVDSNSSRMPMINSMVTTKIIKES